MTPTIWQAHMCVTGQLAEYILQQHWKNQSPWILHILLFVYCVGRILHEIRCTVVQKWREKGPLAFFSYLKTKHPISEIISDHLWVSFWKLKMKAVTFRTNFLLVSLCWQIYLLRSLMTLCFLILFFKCIHLWWNSHNWLNNTCKLSTLLNVTHGRYSLEHYVILAQYLKM